MRTISNIAIFALLGFAAACGSPIERNSAATKSPGPSTVPTPIPTASVPKNGDHAGKGKVTKIDTKLGSVELDHQEIKDVMPAMKMEFFVTDPALLNGLKVGDEVDFILRYKDGQEMLSSITRAR